jgi:hypothetical protein
MLLIVEPDHKNGLPPLAKAAKALGRDVYYGGWFIPTHLMHSSGAVYGEQMFCKSVAKQMNWKLLANPSDWVSKLPEEYASKEATTFTSKYRCFVKNRVVITACCYWKKSVKMTEAELNKPENYINNHDAVIDFVDKMLTDKQIKCAPGTVIDVARFKKDTYTVIDSIAVWTSPIYGCDMAAVLDAISVACIADEDK